MDGLEYLGVLLLLAVVGAIVLPVVIFRWLYGLQSTVDALRSRVDELRISVEAGRKVAEPIARAPKPAPVTDPPPVTATPRTEEVVLPPVPPVAPALPVVPPSPPPTLSAPPPAVPPALRPVTFYQPIPERPAAPDTAEKADMTKDESVPVEKAQWEMEIGGKLFNYIGAITLFFGLAFLLKYAIDNNWITPPLRILLGYVTGFSLLYVGHHFHRKGLPAFAYGVIGAGLAVCYLCGFAAYVPAIVGSPTAAPMVSYPVAFILMSLAAVLAFQRALAYDSQPVAYLGWAGALLTPFILHSGDANLLGLYLYLLLFTAGMVALSARKARWLALEPLTMIAIYLIYLFFCLQSADSSGIPQVDVRQSTVFLLVLAFIFLGGEAYRTLTATPQAYGERDDDGYCVYQPFAGEGDMTLRELAFFLNGAAVYGCLYLTLHATQPARLPSLLLLLAGAYLLTAGWCEYRRRDQSGFIARALIMALLALALAGWHHYTGFSRSIAWMLETVILIASGTVGKRRYLTGWGLLLLAVAYLNLFFQPLLYHWDPIGSFHPIFNLRVLALLTVIAGTALTIRLLRHEPVYGESMNSLLHWGWSLLVFLLVFGEINDAFLLRLTTHDAGTVWVNALHYLLLGFTFIILALPFMQIGWSRRCPPVATTGAIANCLGVLLIGIRAVILVGNCPYHVSMLITGVIFLPVLGVLLLSPAMLRRLCPQMPDGFAVYQYLMAFALGLELVSLELWQGVSWLLDIKALPFAPDEWTVHLLTVGAGMVGYALAVTALAHRARYAVLLQPGLATAICGWMLVISSGFGYIVATDFHPLRNYRAVAMLLLILGLLWQRKLTFAHDDRDEWLAYFRQTFLVFAAITGFILITEEITSYATRLALIRQLTLFGTTPELACTLLLGGGWSCYGVILAWAGLRRRLTPLFITAVGAFVCGVITTAGMSFYYHPAAQYRLLNLHTLVMLVVTVTILGMEQVGKRYRDSHPDWSLFPGLLQVSAVLLLYLLCAQATWLRYSTGISAGLDDLALARLDNGRQLALSTVSFLFAICALGYGFVQKVMNVRVTAIVLFFAVIAKVFCYDLSLLESGYRIISFCGLGILLLTASYLYHRYRLRLAQWAGK